MKDDVTVIHYRNKKTDSSAIGKTKVDEKTEVDQKISQTTSSAKMAPPTPTTDLSMSNISVAGRNEKQILESVEKIYNSLFLRSELNDVDVIKIRNSKIDVDINNLLDLMKHFGANSRELEGMWKPLLMTLTNNEKLLNYIQELSPRNAKQLFWELHRSHLTHGFHELSGKESYNKLIFSAIQTNCSALVSCLLAVGGDVNAKNAHGITPLMLAAEEGYEEILQELIDAGAELNFRNQDNETALMIAAVAGQARSLEILIDAHADLEVLGPGDRTALMMAAKEGQSESVRILVKAGAKLETRDRFEKTALMLAATEGNPESIEALMQAKADSTITDKRGRTVLMLAIDMGHAESAKVILARAPDLKDMRDRDGETAIMVAAKKGHLESVKVLIDAQVNLNLENEEKDTALTIAADAENMEVVRELTRVGARGKSGDVIFEIPREAKYVSEHWVLMNKLGMKINRLNASPEASREFLSVLTDYLRRYQDQFTGDFAKLALDMKGEGEEGVDAGGLTREFIGQMLKGIHFEIFKMAETGQHDPFDTMNNMTPEDVQICKNVGTFLSALVSGFPKERSAKIGNFFSDKFYNSLFIMCKYASEHPRAMENGFDAMNQKDKEDLVLMIADYDMDNESYREIKHCLQSEDCSDQELDALLRFVFDDFMIDKDDWVDKGIDANLMKISDEFIAYAEREGLNYQKLLNEPFTFVGQDNVTYTHEMLRDALRDALSHAEQKTLFKEKFSGSLIDAYSSACIPLVTIGQEFFNRVNKSVLNQMLAQFEVEPAKATKALSLQIQGAPFTREAFVGWLEEFPKSIAEYVNPADAKKFNPDKAVLNEKVTWLIEWCKNGINGKLATEEQMKDTLTCITGMEVVPENPVIFRLYRAQKPLTTFHTCDREVELGSQLTTQKDKEIFIETWKKHVEYALSGGFGVA